MYLSKRKVILVISVSALVFFFTITQMVKSQTILRSQMVIQSQINGEKIRFSGIDTPELKQICINRRCKKFLVEKLQPNKYL